MERANERRAEQRLQYRWPIRFQADEDGMSVQGQIVDISSKSVAFLCHADQSDFKFGQKIKINFSVPYFDQADSFDAVHFDRIGYVSHVEKPSDEIHRVVTQFAMPLFFKPGQQDIDARQAQQRLDAKNFSVIKAQEAARAYQQALEDAQEKLKHYAQAKAKIEETLKSEIEDRFKTEAKLKTRTQEQILIFEEQAAKLKEKIKSLENEIADLQSQNQNEIELRIESQEKVQMLEEQISQIKKQARIQIVDIKTRASEIVEQIKSQSKEQKIQAVKKDLYKKFDKFISDRNKIF